MNLKCSPERLELLKALYPHVLDQKNHQEGNRIANTVGKKKNQDWILE